MLKRIVITALILAKVSFGFAQFLFKGEVPLSYKQANVYLGEVSHYKKAQNFRVNDILASTIIDSSGIFQLQGNFLFKDDRLYSIFIDKCHETPKNVKHVLNQCTEFSHLTFIANNTDTIQFPLNNLGQLLCRLQANRKENYFISQIDSVQEASLAGIENTLNLKQQQLVFKNNFEQLKNYSQSLNHPLAGLYAYDVYANKNEESRSFYLKDLKKSNYYNSLSEVLKNDYAGSLAQSFANDLEIDQLVINKPTSNKNESGSVFWIIALVLSILLNAYLLFKHKPKATNTKPLQKLTQQEQKVLNEIKNGLTNKEIADKLFVSVSTVKSHINNLYTKLGVNSRAEVRNLR